MKYKKPHITVYLDEIQVSGLRVVHENSRVRKAELVRQGIDLMLEKYGASGFIRDKKHFESRKCDHHWFDKASGWQVCDKCGRCKR